MLSQAAIESVQAQEQVLGRDRERESGRIQAGCLLFLHSTSSIYLTLPRGVWKVQMDWKYVNRISSLAD